MISFQSVEDNEIRSIFFDVGLTLIYPDPDYLGACKLVAQSNGAVFSDVALKAGLATAAQYYESHTRLDPTIWTHDQSIRDLFGEFFGLVFSVAASKMNVTVTDPQICKYGAQVYDNYGSSMHWEVFDDAIPTLSKLKQKGFLLGVYSDWHSGLTDLLIELGLHHYFQYIFSSTGIQLAKGQKGAFLKIMDLAKLTPGTVAFVGDSLRLDYLPAEEAGFIPFLVDRGAVKYPADTRVLTTLNDIFCDPS